MKWMSMKNSVWYKGKGEKYTERHRGKETDTES